jgi:PAS domain S-box-containing protein
MALHPGDEKSHPPEELALVWSPFRQNSEETKDWYRDLVEHSHDLLCVHDLEGRLLSINPVPARLLGYSVKEILRMRLWDFIDPRFRDQCHAYLRETKRTGESHGLMAVITRSGNKLIWEYHSTLRTEGVATPIVRTIAHDVTERVHSEKALRAINDRLQQSVRDQDLINRGLILFRTLLDQSNDAIEVINPDTFAFLDVNEKGCEELGYSREELLSMTVSDIDPNVDENSRLQVLQSLRESGSLIKESIHRRKDGSTFPVEINLRLVHLDRDYIVVASRDITERKRAEAALQTTNDELTRTLREQAPILRELTLFRTLLDQSNDAIQVIDPKSLRFLDVNEKACIDLGYSREELLSMTVFDIDKDIDESWRASVRQRLRESGFAIMDRVHWRKNGTTFPVEVNYQRVQLDREYGVAVTRDITERKRSEQELQKANEQLRETTLRQEQILQKLMLFRTLLNHSHDSITVIDKQTLRFLDVNESACQRLGYSREELLSMSIFDIDPTIDESSIGRLRQRLDKAGFARIETIQRRKDGTTFPAEVEISRVQLDREYGVAVSRDITERKAAEGRLQEFERVVEHLEEMIFVFDRDYRYVLANRAFLSYRGVTREQVVGHLVTEIVPPAEFEAVKRNLEECFRGKVVKYEMRYRYPEIGERDLFVTCLPVEGTAGIDRVAVVVRDITNDKRAEEALRASEARERARAKELEAVLDAVPAAVCIARDPDCRVMTGNRAAHQQLRVPAGMNLSQSAFSEERPSFRLLRLGEEIPMAALPMQQAASTGKPVFGQELTLHFEDGTERETLSNAVPLLDEEGKPRGAVGTSIDLTELKLTEKALRESELHFRTVFQRSPVGIALVDSRSGRFLQCNPKFCEIAGREEKEVLQLDISSITHAGDVAQGSEYQRQLVEENLASYEMNKRYIRPDGSLRWVRILVVPMWGKGETQRWQMALVEDITERRRVEEAIATLAQVRAESSGSFFNSMAVQLAKRLEADYTIIGELIAGDQGKVRTIGVCGQGVIADNFTRDLAATPCETVVAQGTCSYASGVTEIFPKDVLLQQMKVEGYAGTPLRDSQGRVIGLMVALYCRPLMNPQFAEMILQVFSTRTAAEIERKRADETLRQSEERFRVALKNSPTAVFNQDRDLRYTWMYNSQLPIADGEKMGKTVIDIFEPEEAARMTEVRRRVLETGVGVRDEMQATFGGRKHYFDVTIEPVFDSAGTVIGITGASTDVTEFRKVTEALHEVKKKLTEEKLYLEQEIDTELGFGEIIGQSRALREVMEQVGKVASSNATVLLLGETGTGKELVARAIHRLSQRSQSSFIKMNCAAIPHGLLESELFGHERGAFTGAVIRKIGRLELADKGTLFLDEIGEISLALQPKLLRVLQDQEFERLGGTQTLKVDFRLIAATNSDLADRVRDHDFRSDLYYRLNVFPIRVPPLRERRDDIRLLVEHFVQKFARRMNRTITTIPKKTMDTLISLDWPGNVRELENYIERSVILTQGSVLVSPLAEVESWNSEKKTKENRVDDTLEGAEREHILRALRESHGRIGGLKGAAARLGLKRTTLQSKIKNLGISSPPDRG